MVTLRRFTLSALIALAAVACGQEADTDAEAVPAADANATPPNNMARALAGGGTIWVIRPSELTAEQGAWTARVRGADYVFTSLESGPWDMAGFTAYLDGMRQAAAAAPDSAATIPVLLRIPPLHEIGIDSVRAKVQEALRVGASGIIFPHLQSREEFVQVSEALGPQGWPANPQGGVVAVHMIEDRVSVSNARELVSTPGVKVVLVGPMSLTSAYENDTVAVENAIQSVLALCKETDVACGITAGVDDVVMRVQQGFRFLVLRDPAALAAGRAALGQP